MNTSSSGNNSLLYPNSNSNHNLDTNSETGTLYYYSLKTSCCFLLGLINQNKNFSENASFLHHCLKKFREFESISQILFYFSI